MTLLQLSALEFDKPHLITPRANQTRRRIGLQPKTPPAQNKPNRMQTLAMGR